MTDRALSHPESDYLDACEEFRQSLLGLDVITDPALIRQALAALRLQYKVMAFEVVETERAIARLEAKLT